MGLTFGGGITIGGGITGTPEPEPPSEINIDGTFSVNASSLAIGIEADDIEFKADGTKMWVTGNAQARPKQYSLSTAWDLSTASEDTISAFSWGHPNIYVQGLAVSADGSTLVILDEGSGGRNYQYDLSTAYDLASASYNTSIGEKNFNVGMLGSSNQETGGARWYDSGNVLSLFGRSRSVVATVDCSANPYTLSGASLINSRMMRDFDAGSSGAGAQMWSADGTILYLMGGQYVTTQCKKFTCSTAFNASTADTDNVTNFSLPSGGGVDSYHGMTHSPDYTKLFVSSGNNVLRIDIS